MKFKPLALVIACSLALASCNSSKTTLPYFSDLRTESSGTLPKMNYMPQIGPDDELAITVTSELPEATMAYNVPSVNPAVRDLIITNSSPRTMTYVVDSEGYINFPVLGRLHVAGMTVEQLQKELAERISRDVHDPLVMVEMVNFTVTVAGEVKTPMNVKVANNRITILEALAAAGDMTEFGERSDVLVVRETDGQRTYAHLNLNSSDVLSSPFYYLQPNDYVYVSPNSIRQANSKYNTNNAYKLSVISTIVSGVSVVASLVIALTR